MLIGNIPKNGKSNNGNSVQQSDVAAKTL